MLFNFYSLVYLATSWLIFLGNLAKILFLDTHAKIMQVRTNLDISMASTVSRCWQDLPRFSMFLIEMYQVSVHGVFPDYMLSFPGFYACMSRFSYFLPGPKIFPKNNGEKSVKSVKIIFLHR